MAVVLVRGTGDVASAVAALLCRAGHRVALHDDLKPSHTRRGMAFADALFHGSAELEGILAKRIRTLRDLPRMLRCGRALPVADGPFGALVAKLRPHVLVDARMRKRAEPEVQRGLALLTIGLGPNFEAGRNVDIAVETAWGNALGSVIRSGHTRPLEGEPQPIGGHARDRYVYAPAEGVFQTPFTIGQHVERGQEIARIGDTAICSPLSGCLRGITHDGATVALGTKVIEVDPRGDPEAARGLGERPRRIAEGVLRAINEDSPRMLRRGGAAFGVGTGIGVLGGLIGLGGAEFRLPALVGLFRFDVREAILINVAISLVTVIASLSFRLGMHGAAALLTHVGAWAALVAGSLAGVYVGSTLVTRLHAHALHRAVGALLAVLGLVMAAHGFMPHGGVPLVSNDAALAAFGIACGIGIGLVGSVLGVAGGELLIPTLVLLYGADIKSAGTVSLAVSIPMLLVTLSRLRRFPAASALPNNWRFVAVMAVGSLIGAFIGSRLVGVAPEHVVSVVLAAILFISARKAFGNRPRV